MTDFVTEIIYLSLLHDTCMTLNFAWDIFVVVFSKLCYFHFLRSKRIKPKTIYLGLTMFPVLWICMTDFVAETIYLQILHDRCMTHNFARDSFLQNFATPVFHAQNELDQKLYTCDYLHFQYFEFCMTDFVLGIITCTFAWPMHDAQLHLRYLCQSWKQTMV